MPMLRGVAQRRWPELLPGARLYRWPRRRAICSGILLTDPMSRDFPVLAERLLQSFRHAPVETAGVPLHITVSIGAVRLPTIAHSATEAMIYAEQALHDANRRGRNLFVEYIDSPERMIENRQLLELSGRVKHAFKL